MKIFISIFLFSLTSSSFGQLKIVKDNIACLYGLKNEKGEWVVKAEYTLITDLKNSKNEQFYLGMINNQYGLFDNSGKVKIPFSYDLIERNNYDRNYFAIKQNGKIGIINYDNEIIIPPKYKRLENIKNDIFLCTNFKDNKYLRDSSGLLYKKSILYAHNRGKINNHSVFDISLNDKTRTEILLSEKFDTIILSQNATISIYKNHIIVAKKDSFLIYSDKTQIVAKFNNPSIQFQYLENFTPDEIVLFEQDKKWGFMQLNGEILKSAIYTSIRKFENNNCILKWEVSVTNKRQFLNNELINPFENKYDAIDFLGNNCEGPMLTYKNNLQGLVKTDGTVLLEPKYRIQKTPNYGFFFSDTNEVFYANPYHYSENDKDILIKLDHYKTLSEYEIYQIHKQLITFYRNSDGNLIYYPDTEITETNDGYILNHNSHNYFFDKTGKPVVKEKSKNKNEGTYLNDSIYIYENNYSEFGLKTDQGKILLKPEFRQIKVTSSKGQTAIWCQKKQTKKSRFNTSDAGNWFLLDKFGKSILDLNFDIPVIPNGFRPVFINGKCGFYDFTKNVFILDTVYRFVNKLNENADFYVLTDSLNEFYIVNENGKLISDQKWTSIIYLPLKTCILEKPYQREHTSFQNWLLITASDSLLINSMASISDNTSLIETYLYDGTILNKNQKFNDGNVLFFDDPGNLMINNDSLQKQIQLYFYTHYSKKILNPPPINYFNCSYRLSSSNSYQSGTAYWLNESERTHSSDGLRLQFTFVSDKFVCMKTLDANKYYHLYKSYGYFFEFELKDLLKSGIDENETIQLLLTEALSLRDDLDLDCHSPRTLYEMTGKYFSFDDSGLIYFLKEKNKNVKLTIPWSKLQKYAPEKGIVADFIEASKK